MQKNINSDKPTSLINLLAIFQMVSRNEEGENERKPSQPKNNKPSRKWLQVQQRATFLNSIVYNFGLDRGMGKGSRRNKKGSM